MRSVRLQFAIACLQYAYKANQTLILLFQLNQVKTYEKSKNQKSYFWHIQVDLKAIWNHIKSKINVSVHCT